MNKISFERIWDFNGDNNRGWIDHRVMMLLDEEVIGSLIISYISSARFPNHYKDGPVSFAHNIKGLCFPDDKGVDWVARVHWAIHSKISSWHDACRVQEQIKSMSFEEAMNFYNTELIPVYKKEYESEFRDFKEYWVDYPIVNYSLVKHEFRRQGFGSRMYIEGARWMSDVGLTLHSSTLRSGLAAEFWAGLIKKGLAKQSTPRRVDTSWPDYKDGFCPRYEIALERL